jgi:hypothetical protein
MAKFHGNASFATPSTTSSFSSSLHNQTAMETMLNQVLALATSTMELQLLRQDLMHVSADSILQGCTNITTQLDIHHLLTTTATTATATTTTTTTTPGSIPSSSSSDDSSTLTTLHALIITLVLFCTAVFMVFLYVKSRNNNSSSKPTSRPYSMGGGRDETSFQEQPATPNIVEPHHSPEVFKILQESDRYLSQHRPDLFRALQSVTTRNNNNNDNSSNSNSSSHPPWAFFSKAWAWTTLSLSSSSSRGGNTTDRPPLRRPSALTKQDRSRSSSYYRNKRNGYSSPTTDANQSMIIMATRSIDHEDEEQQQNAKTLGTTRDANTTTTSLLWDGSTGFTPISTWVSWATGGWMGGDPHHHAGEEDRKSPTSATAGSQSPPHQPPLHLRTINLLNDEEEEDEEEIVYGKSRDGIFRYDVEDPNHNTASSMACDEDPTHYPFVYRDFPRHDGTPCLIFEIGDEDYDDNVSSPTAANGTAAKEGEDDKDVFGSWKSLLKRSSLSKTDLLTYFSSNSNVNNTNPDTTNNSNTPEERKSLTSAKGPILNNVDLVSEDDLHRMLEQHAMDHYWSRSSQSRKKGGVVVPGAFPTDPELEEDFKPHLERLLASRFRQYEKRSILERHREARQKERQEAAAAIAAARSRQSDNDDDDEEEEEDEEEEYDDYDDDDDEEDEEEHEGKVHRRASQRQLDMERDISALEDSISPRSGTFSRKTCPEPPPPALTTTPAQPATTVAYNPWSSTSSFQSSVYVPPPPASSPYIPPPPPPVSASSSHYDPPSPALTFESAIASKNSHTKTQSLGSADHQRKFVGRGERAVEYTLDFQGIMPPKVETPPNKVFDSKKLRDAYKDFNAPSMDELLGSKSNFDISTLRASFADSNAPSMDELRDIPIPQEPLDEFLHRMALESSSKRSSASSIVNDVNVAPLIILDSASDRDSIPAAPPHKFSTPSGRRRRKIKHERSLSDFDFGGSKRSLSSQTHRSDNGDLPHPKPHKQHHHKRTASYTEEAMLRGDISHHHQQQQHEHKRTPSFTDDVMVHGIYAQIRHDKYMFETNNDEKMMH